MLHYRLSQAKRALGNKPGSVKATSLGLVRYHLSTPLEPRGLTRAASASAAKSPSASMEPVVTVDWLSERLNDLSVRVLDACWYMPVHQRNNHADHRAVRIPGARFFDIDGIAADPVTARGLPHMLPSEQ
ncbi:hypothetical protein VaNZ11_014517, partial [Volvox africanus]